jgi:hypothetical protein
MGGTKEAGAKAPASPFIRRRTAYFLVDLRADFLAPFFAAFLRAPPFFAPAFAPFFADDLRADFFAVFFFAAAMVISSDGVERSIEPPVVRTSQWSSAEAPFHRGTASWRVGDVMRRLCYMAALVLRK